MSDQNDWEIPEEARPHPSDYGFDVDAALASVVAIRTRTADDAFTASVLGTERAGNGVVIREDGLIVTIGYLITEAETVWLTTATGQAVPAHAVGYDQTSGLGLVQALGRVKLPALTLGSAAKAALGDDVVIGAHGGRRRSLAARITGKREFAGYWEYVLDEALFTAPAHPNWAGTAVIGPDGRLIGLGSLHVQERKGRGQVDVNMSVPIDLLPPILDDLLTQGSPREPARPWLGLYATEAEEGHLVVVGIASRGPAAKAGVKIGDVVVAVAGDKVDALAPLFRRVWALGAAGVEVPLTLSREGRMVETRIHSASRADFLKPPRLH
jgi:S1-C subfamily serine protease